MKDGLFDLKIRAFSWLETLVLVLKEGGTQSCEATGSSVFFSKTFDFLAGRMLVLDNFFSESIDVKVTSRSLESSMHKQVKSQVKRALTFK